MDNTDTNSEFKTFNSGCECIWNLTQNWGHVSCWNFEILRTSLLNAGFKNVKKSLFKNGDNQKLLIDLEHREWESLYVEAIA